MLPRRNEISIFLNSANATRKNPLGNECDFRLTPPIKLPPNSHPVVRCVGADIPYVTPNVSAQLGNNTMKFHTWDTTGSTDTYATLTGGVEISTSITEHTITFPDGLYHLRDINERVLNYLAKSKDIEDDVVSMFMHPPTLKTIIDFDSENSDRGIAFLFDDSSSIGNLMGFDTREVVVFDPHDNTILYANDTGAGDDHLQHASPSIALYDVIRNYELHLSVLSGSESYGVHGHTDEKTMCTITPTGIVGSVTIYRPPVPLSVTAHELAGMSVENLQLTLTDHNSQDIKQNIDFSARLIISYDDI